MKNSITFYHNPRCSKSRQTLALVEASGIDFEVVHYLQTPPTSAELKRIIAKLMISPRQLLRTSEPEYKQHKLEQPSTTDSDMITAMVNSPKLIERPIVVRGDKAVIGRPPENVNKLL